MIFRAECCSQNTKSCKEDHLMKTFDTSTTQNKTHLGAFKLQKNVTTKNGSGLVRIDLSSPALILTFSPSPE
jgi:hypothetical protein